MLVWGAEEFVSGVVASTDTGAELDPTTLTWRNIPDTFIAPRQSVAVWTGSELLVWGGQSPEGKTIFNGGELYNPATRTWKTMSIRYAPEGRTLASTTIVIGPNGADPRVVVWGGIDTSVDGPNPAAGILYDGSIYNVATDNWTQLPKGILSPRIGAAMVWTGHELIVWGGQILLEQLTPNAPREMGIPNGASLILPQ